VMWYHDHAHGITRTNAYSGLASGYLIIDPAQDVSVGSNTVDALGSLIPLVFQDKVFVTANTQVTDRTWDIGLRPPGSLWYDHVYDPAAFRLLTGGNYILPPDPSCIPEFFGDTMLCNGTVYPLLEVEAKRYRILMLNACNARFLNINTFVANTGNPDGIDLDTIALFPTNPAGPNMIQIGTEGGYLAAEVVHASPKPFNPATLTGNLLLAPAERADLIIDFTGFAGQEIILYNDAPGPFPGGPPTTDYYLGNPLNPVWPQPGTGPDTRQILRIKVVAATSSGPQPAIPILNPLKLDPLPIAPIINVVAPIAPLVPPAGTPVRDLTLNESFDQYGRLKQLIGTTKPGLAGKGFGLDYMAPPTEVVNAGATEVWRIFNLTADTHPLHFHLVTVQVLSRQPFRYTRGRFLASGTARGPEPNELGWKETVQMHPGEVTTVLMRFDMPAPPVLAGVGGNPDVPLVIPSSNRATLGLGVEGLGLTPGPTYHEYVWHCHILEHEEHDMMRPLIVKS
jgi:spore coat protein A